MFLCGPLRLRDFASELVGVFHLSSLGVKV